MKKLLALMTALLLLAGCGTKEPTPTVEPTPEAPTTVMAGIGSYVTFGGSHTKDATADAAGALEIDTMIASVVTDLEGTILYINIDTCQNSAKFDAEGQVAEGTAAIPSKKLLKEDYGMKKASAIGKEWYEQMVAFEEWALGKNLSEVAGLALDADAHTTDADLLTSVTIKLTDYVAALQVAAANMVEVDAAAKYGAANSSSMTAKSATADAEGSMQMSDTYVLSGFDADGKVVFTMMDVAQNKGTFSAEGIVNPENKIIDAKKALGTAYGMTKASPIGKEWFEQAAAYEAWTVGKTVAEINAVETDEAGHVLDADLATGCTMSVTAFGNSIAAAEANAK